MGTPEPPLAEEHFTPLTIGEHRLLVEIADTPLLRAKGLSDHAQLLPDHGMLFIFGAPDHPQFWMREMRFPIDIIWIDEHKTVIGATSFVSPDSYPRRFSPSAPVLYALEVSAGWASAHRIEPGMAVQW